MASAVSSGLETEGIECGPQTHNRAYGCTVKAALT